MRSKTPFAEVREILKKHHPCQDSGWKVPCVGFRLECNVENGVKDCFQWKATFPEIVISPPHEEMNDDIWAIGPTIDVAISGACKKLKEKQANLERIYPYPYEVR